MLDQELLFCQEVGIFEDVTNGKIRSAYTDGIIFDKAVNILNSKGYQITPSKKHMELLLQEGAKSPIVYLGYRVREGKVIFPDNRAFLVRNSLALNSLEKFAQSDVSSILERNKCYISEEEAHESLKDSISLDGYKSFFLPVNEIINDSRAIFLFGENNNDIKDFLLECGFEKIQFPSVPSKSYIYGAKSPFIEQLYIEGWAKEEGTFAVTSYSSSMIIQRVRGYK